MQPTPATREFHWISSVEGEKDVLRSLHEAMMSFYAESSERSGYQDMLDEIDEDPDGDTSTTRLTDYISGVGPESVLEVGCGNGRLFRTMTKKGFDTDYTGVEVAEYVIERNRNRHPEACWYVADAYDLPVDEGEIDLVCAEFVLEHLVFPRRALKEMIRVLRPGGHLVLIFPDFVCAGRLASQVIGLSPGSTALNRLQQGRPIDAAVSLYDSRIRLPTALKKARKNYGPFPVNLRPKCLTYPNIVSPDVDAVYIASKEEVADWARDQGYTVKFPWGTDSRLFRETAHIAIAKR